MKNLRFLAVMVVLGSSIITGRAQNYHVRIGFIGNSITQGSGLLHPGTEAYPNQLQVLLNEHYGDTCIVNNFGLTTTTMLKDGDVSYWDTQELRDYLAYAPEICFIMLGTNDTKPQNWDVHGDRFIGDYLDMIDTIKRRNPSTKFMFGYPPPAFEVKWGIRDSVILNGVRPALDSVLMLVDADWIDFYYPLLDSIHLFPDHIHPSVAGAGVMAEMILERMTGTDMIHKADTGLTFITSFRTAKPSIMAGEETRLSWTTINADSLFLNGTAVPVNERITVSPLDTTLYELVATGALSSDTAYLTQMVYIRELARLRISPREVTREEGDTILFRVYYFDQFDDVINDQTFPVEWNITAGNGILFGQTETSVYYVAGIPGESFLEVRYGDISDEARITTSASPAGLEKGKPGNGVRIFPNPAGEQITVHAGPEPGCVIVSVYNAEGILLLKQAANGETAGPAIIRVDTGDLQEGNYILRVEKDGQSVADRVVLVSH